MKKYSEKKEIWIYNLSNKDFGLNDLNGVRIPAMKSMNVLRDGTISEKMIQASLENGDLKAKSKWLKIGGSPYKRQPPIMPVSQLPMEVPNKGGFEMVKEVFKMEVEVQHMQDENKFFEQMLAQEDVDEQIDLSNLSKSKGAAGPPKTQINKKK